MSRENVEIARKVNAAFNAGDWNAVLELHHPEVEFRDLQHPPDMWVGGYPDMPTALEAVGLER
jgi:hypothetical protein